MDKYSKVLKVTSQVHKVYKDAIKSRGGVMSWHTEQAILQYVDRLKAGGK